MVPPPAFTKTSALAASCGGAGLVKYLDRRERNKFRGKPDRKWRRPKKRSGRPFQRSGPIRCRVAWNGALHLGRHLDAVAHLGERRRDHEDDEHHEHHVDERRDVDVALDSAAATYAH